jgi:DnaJ-class molecular chaperone
LNYKRQYNKTKQLFESVTFDDRFDTLSLFLVIPSNMSSTSAKLDGIADEDLYAHLELSMNATKAEILKQYRRLVLVYHPDKAKDNPEAPAKFLKIQKAYELLQDDEARRAYDAVLRVRQMRQKKDSEMDSKKRKMKEDLEEREKFAKKQRREEEDARERLAKEMDRVKHENAEKLRRLNEERYERSRQQQQQQQPIEPKLLHIRQPTSLPKSSDLSSTKSTTAAKFGSVSKEEHQRLEEETLLMMMQATEQQQ